jgi:hypothetical protein
VGLTDGRDCAARIGGDEFAILVTGRTRAEIGPLAADFAQVIPQAGRRAGLEGPDLSAGVGYALWPEDGRDLAELLDAADRAMYITKAASKRAAGEISCDPIPSVDTATPVGDCQPCAPSVEPSGAGPRPTLVSPGARSVHGPRGARERVATWWRKRPARTLAAAMAWFGCSAIILGVVFLPYADRTHLSQVVALVAFCLAMGGCVLFLAPLVGEVAFDISAALALPSIALAVYLTGGTTSPLLPLVLVVVLFAAYASSRRSAMIRLAVAVLVCMTPFLYADGDARLGYILRFVALITTAQVLVGTLLYSKRELAQAEQGGVSWPCTTR